MVKGSTPHPSTTAPSGARRRRRLTRDEIAEAVVEMGFEQLTVTGLATQLGVNHATLYGHVASRDEMVLAGIERLMASAGWPDLAPDWRATLAAEAWHMFRLYLDHPGLAVAIGTSASAPRRMVERYGQVSLHLRQLGFASDAALGALDLVHHLTADAAQHEHHVRATPSAQRDQWLIDWSASLDEELRQAMGRTFSVRTDERFTMLLDVVLAGIAARLAPG